jgi:thioredoxin 1
MSSNVPEVTDATFDELVTQNERPVIVDFWAAWCGPCRLVAPEIDKIAEKYAGQVDVYKLDVDANPHIASHFGIMSIPTVAYFQKGPSPTSRRANLPRLRSVSDRWPPWRRHSAWTAWPHRRRQPSNTVGQARSGPRPGALCMLIACGQ